MKRLFDALPWLVSLVEAGKPALFYLVLGVLLGWTFGNSCKVVPLPKTGISDREKKETTDFERKLEKTTPQGDALKKALLEGLEGRVFLPTPQRAGDGK